MAYPRISLLFAFISLPAVLVVVLGCSGGLPAPPTTPEPATPLVETTDEPATETPVPEAPVSATEAPPTEEPSTPTAEPPTPTPEPAGGLSFQPAQIAQGGYALLFLDEPAANATATFGGRQYPMLPEGARWWALLGAGAFAEPGLAPVTVAYTPPEGGEPRTITQSIQIVDHDYPVENINLDPETSALLDPEIVSNELAIRRGILSGYTTQRLWSAAFVRPADGAISSSYGTARSYNNGPVSSYHTGTDFVGEIGDPVYAAAAGRVVFTDELQVRGNAVMIDHGAGLFTAYHHLSAINVNQGDVVVPGQVIGAIGSTGLVTGPHLHWEVVVRGVEVDGERWLEGIAIGP